MRRPADGHHRDVPYEPDPPTRRIPPVRAAPAPAPLPPREQVAVDPALAWQQVLEDRLRGLRTALAVVGTLAVAALGLALWTLLDEDGQEGRQGASAQRVADLDDRVDRFEERLDNRATTDDLEALRTSQEQLAERVDEVAKAPQPQEDGASDEAVAALQQDVQALQQRVDDLAAAPPEEGTQTTP